jgi:hypothetical protein
LDSQRNPQRLFTRARARLMHAETSPSVVGFLSGPQMQTDEDAAELEAEAAQRRARYEEAQRRKRSGGAARQHKGRGSNPNSLEHGLAAAARSTYICRTEGCRALVDAGRARACAAAAWRARFLCGDGCASQKCASRFRLARFVARQQEMATALEEGTRTLREWPEGIGGGVGQRRGTAAARQAAADARQSCMNCC